MSYRSFKGKSYKGAPVRKARYPGSRRGPPSRAYGRRKVTTKRVLAEVLGVETKFLDTSLAATALVAPADSTGGEFDPSAMSMISTPAVGDGEQNRDGKRIIIKNVYLKVVLNLPAQELVVAPQIGTKVFVALVQDTQSNAAQMNSEDCFKNTAAIAATAMIPQRNLLFSNRFRVLKYECVDLTPDTLSHFANDSFSVGGKTVVLDWFLPLDMPVNFNAGTTASIANVIDNSLHVIAFSNTIVGAPTIAYNARVRFQG